jgi:hypothetical protein
MLDRRKYDLSLRNVAERHPNDIIANAASALAVKMESLGTAFGTDETDITETDRQLMEMAISWCQANRELFE